MTIFFSKRWASYLAVKTGQSRENEAVLAYVIEVLAINLVNTVILISLGLIFDVLTTIIACMITMALLRFTAGGAHSNNPWRCAVVTAFVFLSIALISSYLFPTNQLYINITATFTIIFTVFSIIRFAPVDSPSAPIISAVRRKRLRLMSLFVVAFLAAAVVFLQQFNLIYTREIQVAIILCALWGSLNLTGIGHRVMALIDKINITPKRKEV